MRQRSDRLEAGMVAVLIVASLIAVPVLAAVTAGRASGGRESRRAGLGRGAHLRGRQQLVITSIAAALGLLMIILKDVVLIHLH